jgi:hypothetical protein
MNTMTKDRKARILAGQLAAFEGSVRFHFTYPPATWFVRKVADRRWYITHDGMNKYGQVRSFDTKRKAVEWLDDSNNQDIRAWRERSEWYLETSRDPRNRKLSDAEREIVQRVLAEK